MTLAELTALMSRVGRKHRELLRDRNVGLFIDACIEEARSLPEEMRSPPIELRHDTR